MKLHHRIQLGFWGAIARIGHLMQRREVRVLEKQVYQQGRTIHHLVAANIELQGRLRECEAQLKTAIAERWELNLEATKPRISEELAA